MRWSRAAAAGIISLGVAACQLSPVGPAGATSPSVTASRVLPAGNPPGPWRLRFDDEFTGRSLSREHWATGWLGSGITRPVNPAELECYDPVQVRVGSGALLLSLARRHESCGKPRPFASGMVNSDGKFQFRYGFAEARAWLPGRGPLITNWPAFWLDGQHWPDDGEIDVVEGLAGQACWHFVDPHANPGGCVPGGYANGWHTFGADWEPGSITYYYDGHVTGRITRGITSAPMYLILNLAAARAYGSRVRVPATMRVDYVRVWRHPG